MICPPQYYRTRGSWGLWNLPRVTNNEFKDLIRQLYVIDPPEYYATRGRLMISPPD